jgi:hypothetical protein
MEKIQSVGLSSSSDGVNLLHKNMHSIKTTIEIISHKEEAGLKVSPNDIIRLFMPQHHTNSYYKYNNLKMWQISDLCSHSQRNRAE